MTPASVENASAPRDLPPGVEVTMVPIGPPPHPWVARLHDARTGGITPGIVCLEAFRASPEFADAVASADLVEIHWQHLLPLANDVRNLRPGLPITAFMHDVMTQKARREANQPAMSRPASDRPYEPTEPCESNPGSWLRSIRSLLSRKRTLISFGEWA